MKTIIRSRKATKEYLVKRATTKLDADEKELLDSAERRVEVRGRRQARTGF